jgi:hypothetical protein
MLVIKGWLVIIDYYDIYIRSRKSTHHAIVVGKYSPRRTRRLGGDLLDDDRDGLGDISAEQRV